MRVNVRSVEEVRAEVKSTFHNQPRLIDLNHPFLRIAKRHCSKTDARDLKSCGAQSNVLHRILQRTTCTVPMFKSCKLFWRFDGFASSPLGLERLSSNRALSPVQQLNDTRKVRSPKAGY